MAPEHSARIGFIGLGVMGRAMAHNLLGAGFAVTVWNRSPAACEGLVAAGARRAEHAAEAAACDVLVTMLADDDAVRAVVDAHDLIAAMPDHGVHVNMATCSIECAREMTARHAEAGRDYVAAPVLGRPDIARAARLNIVAAGAARAVERARPALVAMGQNVWPAGDEPHRANAIKLAANFMLVTAVEAMGEATSLTSAYGVEPADFLEIITGSVFAAPAYLGYSGAMADRDYDNPEGFRLALGAKDMNLALAAARAEHVPLPLAATARERLVEALAAGEADLDLSVLAEGSRRAAHLDDRD